MKFLTLYKLICENSNNLDNKAYLRPEDIYNFYYMNYMFTDPKEKNNLDNDQIASIEYEIKQLKEKYLVSFYPIVKSQLKKYLIRKRVNDKSYSLEDINIDNYEELDKMMHMTFRSDMVRRNVTWEDLTKNLAELQKNSETNKIMFYIDRINNAIHNTQESIMTKFNNANALIKSLDDCHRLSPDQLKFKTSGLEFLM